MVAIASAIAATIREPENDLIEVGQQRGDTLGLELNAPDYVPSSNCILVASTSTITIATYITMHMHKQLLMSRYEQGASVSSTRGG
jgi:hypothetical protein